MGLLSVGWVGALAAVVVATGSGPRPASTSLPAAPSIVRSDGQVAAAVIPGNRRHRCARIVLWRVGHTPKTIRRLLQCTANGSPVLPDGVIGLALAGTTVAWQETTGGNHRELTIWKATLERPKPVLVAYAESQPGSPGGAYNGDLAGHGGLIVYATWMHCDAEGTGGARQCAKGQPDVYAQTLKRLGGGVLRRGHDVLDPIWVDSGRVLIRHADGTLLLLDGPVARSFPATPKLRGAAVEGRQLVTLTPDELAVYDTETAKRTRTIALLPAARVLEDVQSGIAVLGREGTTHLIRLGDGKGATFLRAAHAQLEPAGLFYASGKRLVFVPRTAVLRRFG
jgi:hypothetical protein